MKENLALGSLATTISCSDASAIRSRDGFYECGVARDTGAGATISRQHVSILVEVKSLRLSGCW